MTIKHTRRFIPVRLKATSNRPLIFQLSCHQTNNAQTLKPQNDIFGLSTPKIGFFKCQVQDKFTRDAIDRFARSKPLAGREGEFIFYPF